MNLKLAKKLRKIANFDRKKDNSVLYKYLEKVFYNFDKSKNVIHKTLRLSEKCTRYKYHQLKKAARG